MALPQTQHDTKTLPDAWDYKGRPALRSPSGGWSSAAMILGDDFSFTFTTYSVSSTEFINSLHSNNILYTYISTYDKN